MKQPFLIVTALSFLVFVLPGYSQTSLKAGHPFVCTDYTQGKVFIVSSEGKTEWEYPAEYCNDIWVLKNGHLLFKR